MGTRGPVPQRSDQRLRRNKDEGSEIEKLHAVTGHGLPVSGSSPAALSSGTYELSA
ncbi:hypothetical protein [Kibdelosporangium aridum]|uniref:Uncharacterized protein n=1 Tax=Kibdelosporangium aridum TaxID=2030 RepID=A0A1W2FX35_KIBAR|nr:hypothetical protein [Kibdelosporangium aridum]SMD26485.1 hypothetical protein SAMN05661093_10068 [Kibdelosporangium aridum]